MSIDGLPDDCFLYDIERVRRRFGPARWRCVGDKQLFEWDSLHKHIEVYNLKGFHIGVMNTERAFIADAVKGRRIDV